MRIYGYGRPLIMSECKWDWKEMQLRFIYPYKLYLGSLSPIDRTILLSQVVWIYIVLGLHFIQLLLLLVQVLPFKRLRRLIVENNEIPIADVKSGEMVAGVLCIEDVLVDDKCCSSGLRSVAPEMFRKENYFTSRRSLLFNLLTLWSAVSPRTCRICRTSHRMWFCRANYECRAPYWLPEAVAPGIQIKIDITELVYCLSGTFDWYLHCFVSALPSPLWEKDCSGISRGMAEYIKSRNVFRCKQWVVKLRVSRQLSGKQKWRFCL